MLLEIIHELTAIQDMSTVTIDHILPWARWVETQRMQTTILNDSKVNKEFNVKHM